MYPTTIEEVLAKQLSAVEEFWHFMCSRPTVEVIPELDTEQERFFACGRCNTYHVFPISSPFRGLRSAVSSKASGILFHLKRTEVITSEVYEEVLSELIAVRDAFNEEVSVGNAAYVEAYELAHPKVEDFVSRNGSESVAHAYIFDGVYRPTDEYIIPIAQLSDDLLLEFWECGRKKGHLTVEKAEKALRQTVKGTERDDLSVYQCKHCDKFHFGRSFKKRGRKVEFNAPRRRAARDYYMQNSIRANNFIHKLMFS